MSRKAKAESRPQSPTPAVNAAAAPLSRRRAIAWAVLIAVGAVAAWFGWDEVSKHRAYEAAVAAIDRYDYGDAADRLHAFLERWPNDVPALVLRAQTARRQGDVRDALRTLDAAERAGALPEAVDAERQLVRLQQGDLDKADQLLRFCEAQPSGPQTALILEALFEGGVRALRPSVSKDAADRWLAFRKAPLDQAIGHLWVGRLHEFALDFPAAIAEYRRAVELAPDCRTVRLRLAETLLQDDPVAAAPHLERLLAAHPTDPHARLLAARRQRTLGRAEEAAKTLDAILVSDPDRVAVLLERGRVALDLNQTAEAERVLRRALELAPADREATLSLADALRLAGKTEESRQLRSALQEIDARLQKAIEALANGAKHPSR